MKKMSLIIGLFLSLHSQVYAKSLLTCIKNPDVDSRISIELTQKNLTIGFWESSITIPTNKISVIQSVDKAGNQAKTKVIIANQVKALWEGEGEKETQTATAIVVYTPASKSAVVTVLNDSGTVLKNEAFTHCK